VLGNVIFLQLPKIFITFAVDERNDETLQYLYESRSPVGPLRTIQKSEALYDFEQNYLQIS
jgi:hypothetical protein